MKTFTLFTALLILTPQIFAQDSPTIINDVNTTASNVVALQNAVNNVGPNTTSLPILLIQILRVQSAGTTLDNSIYNTNTDLTGVSTTLTEQDSSTINAMISEISSNVGELLNTLISKKSSFVAANNVVAGTLGQVGSQIQQICQDTSIFGTMICPLMTPDQTVNCVNTSTPIAGDCATAEAAYPPPAS